MVTISVRARTAFSACCNWERNLQLPMQGLGKMQLHYGLWSQKDRIQAVKKRLQHLPGVPLCQAPATTPAQASQLSEAFACSSVAKKVEGSKCLNKMNSGLKYF